MTEPIEDPIVVLKCANRAEAEAVAAHLRERAIDSILLVDDGSQRIMVAVSSEHLEAALESVASLPAREATKRNQFANRHNVEWTGRCPACGSMRVSPIESGALATASIVIAALWAAAYAGAKRIHLSHPVIDTFMLAPVMLFPAWWIYRRTPNARCDACNTYWKARR